LENPISANVIWGKNMKWVREKGGKCKKRKEKGRKGKDNENRGRKGVK
jgi:hypothetical protein